MRKQAEVEMKKSDITGKKAPDFSLPDLNGKEVSLSDYHGKPVLILFWSIASPVCKKSLPNVAKFAEDIKDSDIVMLGVNLDANNPEVAKLAKESGVTFPTLVGAEKSFAAANAFGVMRLPVIFVVGKDGTVKGRIFGPFQSPDELDSEVEKYDIK